MSNRRSFIKLAATVSTATFLNPISLNAGMFQNKKIRLGGPVFKAYQTPEEWISNLRENSYRAAYCPVQPGESLSLIEEYKLAAKENDILIAEVGAWSNPISTNKADADEALKKCIDALELAEQIGANCCVNVSGSRNPEHWAGPHKDNYSKKTFDLIVKSSQKIIDAVKPSNTYFVLEPMPWALPDSAESYQQLIEAINRDAFAVHLDPVNMIRSPREYYNNGNLIRGLFEKLGPRVRSCHAKDILLREDNYIPQMDEVLAGTGKLNYPVFLDELVKLNDIPLMMEHLSTGEEYKTAAKYIRKVGTSAGISL